MAIFFYFLVLINPGYVPKQRNFMGLLERLLDEKFYLDYVCVYCENLRPENASHCNFCHRCVEKFDHHCNFVNNCLGYRNHKYFLFFLVFFFVYMSSIVVHTINSFVIFTGVNNCTLSNITEPPTKECSVSIPELVLQCYLLAVIVMHSPMVLLQLKS